MNIVVQYRDQYGQVVSKAANIDRARNILNGLEKCSIRKTDTPLSNELTVDEFIAHVMKSGTANHIIFVDSQGSVIAGNCTELASFQPCESDELNKLLTKFFRIQFMDCELTIKAVQYIMCKRK